MNHMELKNKTKTPLDLASLNLDRGLDLDLDQSYQKIANTKASIH